MEIVTLNLRAGTVRRAAMGGRDYLVAPLTLIVPGVLNGSQGPLFYPPEELAKHPDVWNHTPIVVRHPEAGSQPVSARDPDVLNRQGVGVVLHAKANGKLQAEGWFDLEATRRVDSRLLTALERGQPIELSTGLFTENEPADGTHNGKTYTHIARNYRPDHLAILPDATGACSIADGCGVNVNASKTVGGKSLSASTFAYVPDAAKPSTWKLRIDDAQHVSGAIAAIGKGFRGQKVEIPAADLPGVKQKLKAAWKKFHPDKSEKDVPSVLNERHKTMNEEQRKATVDYIVANCGYCDDEDREQITTLSDEKLTAWQDQLKTAVANAEAAKKTEELQVAVNQLTKDKAALEQKTKELTANQDDKPGLTAEQEEKLAFADQMLQERKQAAVTIITANEANAFTAEQLADMSLGTLEGMAKLAKKPEKPIANWAGAAGSVAGRTDETKFAPFGLPASYVPAEND